MTYDNMFKPLFFGIPFIVVDWYFWYILENMEQTELMQVLTYLNSDIFIACTIIIGYTFFTTKPKLSPLYVKHGKRAYVFNTLTSYLLSIKSAALLISFYYLT